LIHSISYFCGYPGFIYRINDGQSNFDLWQSELHYSGYYQGLDIINYDTVWATAVDIGRYDSSIINYTFDGGKTWQFQHFAPNISWQSIHFIDGRHGYMIGYISDYWGKWYNALLASTEDYGKTWTIITLPYDEALTGMSFINDSIAYITGDKGLLLRMNTKGKDTFTSVNYSFGEQSSVNLYPNPANGIITLKYTIPKKENAGIGLYDLAGRKIAEILPLNTVSAGTYSIKYNSERLRPGAYFIRLQVGNEIVTRKFIKLNL
jgi:hypothetical protein